MAAMRVLEARGEIRGGSSPSMPTIYNGYVDQLEGVVYLKNRIVLVRIQS